ncbi:MAG: 16S rRNA (uracil(1498)-N(3))-methyltransferase [Kiritimatiellaeota bacterium]|nr:16S rRNA (uracil(1498)-N(3))-methyltransferase [Kiritimatiellota bacterium]
MHSLLFREANLTTDSPLNLSREQSHHVVNVLRLKPGATIRILNGAGASREAELTTISKHAVTCEFRGDVRTLPQPAPKITLFQCVAKTTRMDWLIEKATELAVSRIVPVLSERTIAGANTERWTRIAESAICQCGGGYLPDISEAVKWDGALARIRDFIDSKGVVFTGALTPDAPPLCGINFPTCQRIGFLIGPEGDFTPDEYESAAAAGARPVSFGPQVLRVETAAIFAVCAARFLR